MYFMALADLSVTLGLPLWAMVLLLIWAIIWKGFALWKSARLNQKVWFVAILIINTFGVLEILYLFVFSKFGFDHLRMRKR